MPQTVLQVKKLISFMLLWIRNKAESSFCRVRFEARRAARRCKKKEGHDC